MKLIILLIMFVSMSFAGTAKFEDNVIALLHEAVYYGDIEAFHNLEFVGVNAREQETFKLTYSYLVYGDRSYSHGGKDIDEITGSKKTCEYIVYDTDEEDFLFTELDCSVDESKALGKQPGLANNEAEISEVLQTDPAFDFILDYEVPEYAHTIVDELNGNLEIYKLDYVDAKNNSRCEYIIFDPEVNFLELTGVSCDQPVAEVIDENLRET